MEESLDNVLQSIKKIKKKDRPVLKPLTQLKRGRKKKPVIEMTQEFKEVVVYFD